MREMWSSMTRSASWMIYSRHARSGTPEANVDMPLRINVITIFPEFFAGPLGLSIPSRAAAAGSVTYNIVDLRNFTHDKHRTVDDAPYGGGAGMVMKPEAVFEAVRSHQYGPPNVPRPSRGRVFPHAAAERLSNTPEPSIL